MSDPSEVMGGSDLRCLKPQEVPIFSRESEIAFEQPMCAQIRPMRTFLSNSKLNLKLVKIKSLEIRREKNQTFLILLVKPSKKGRKEFLIYKYSRIKVIQHQVFLYKNKSVGHQVIL